jgi:tetratricopeptide (TPR) repeat protein
MNQYRLALLALVAGLLGACGQKSPVTPPSRLSSASEKLARAKTEQGRFYALNDAAKQSFTLGNIEDARKYANDLLALLPRFPNDWNYGNAVQDGHLVLGRIAVREGRIEDAKRHLQEAGKSPGSPQMDSFGPNMSLAKDLIEKGERDAVLEYFELCRKFWRMDRGRLDQWRQEVLAGKIPDFGANLVY